MVTRWPRHPPCPNSPPRWLGSRSAKCSRTRTTRQLYFGHLVYFTKRCAKSPPHDMNALMANNTGYLYIKNHINHKMDPYKWHLLLLITEMSSFSTGIGNHITFCFWGNKIGPDSGMVVGGYFRVLKDKNHWQELPKGSPVAAGLRLPLTLTGLFFSPT